LKIEIDHLMTEQRNPNTTQIDQLSTQEMLTLINAEDRLVAEVVAQEIPEYHSCC
jgi:N-acetylmuramic acid 6-phosphate etherase